MNKTPAQMHKVLCQIGEDLGLPENYKDDLLVHDLAWLRKWWKGLPFVFLIRNNGTHLWHFPHYPGDPMSDSLRSVRYVIEHFPDQCKSLWYFDGEKLEPVTVERLKEIQDEFYLQKNKGV